MTQVKCRICQKICEPYAKGICAKCYNRQKNKKYYDKHTFSTVTIGKKKLCKIFDRDVIKPGDTAKFVKYKEKEILDDMLRNPRKYLDEL